MTGIKNNVFYTCYDTYHLIRVNPPPPCGRCSYIFIGTGVGERTLLTSTKKFGTFNTQGILTDRNMVT